MESVAISVIGPVLVIISNPIIIIPSFIFSIPDLIDFVLTYKLFSENLKSFDISNTYFIIRFISQGFNFIHNCSFVSLLLGPRGIEGLMSLLPYCLYTIIMIIFEITSFIYFQKVSSDLELITRIGYYIHFLYIPLNIIIISYNVRKEKNL